jgi:hypothetical protein
MIKFNNGMKQAEQGSARIPALPIRNAITTASIKSTVYEFHGVLINKHFLFENGDI